MRAAPHGDVPARRRSGRPSGARRARSTVPALLVLLSVILAPWLLSGQPAEATDTTPIAGEPAPGSPGHTTVAVRPAGLDGAAPAAAPPSTAVTDVDAVDPQYPFVGYVKFAITQITPTVIMTGGGNLLTVTGIMTNTSQSTVYDLRYVFQRSDALAGVKAIQAEIADPGRPSAVVGQNWKILGPSALEPTRSIDLPAGGRQRFVATVGIDDADGLSVRERGVYALMLKVSGDVGQQGRTEYERVGELHLLATVLSPPGLSPPGPPVLPTGGGTAPPTGPAPGGPSPDPGTGSTARQAPASTTGAPTPVGTVAAPKTIKLNMLWPLVDKPHLGIEGVFLDDDLAAELAPGGRLSGILTELTVTDPQGKLTTVVVDPALLDEIERMSGGYRVVSVPGQPQPALTPASETSAPGPVGATPTRASAGPSTSSRPAPTTRPSRSPSTGTTAVRPPSTSATPSKSPGAGTTTTLGSGAVNRPFKPPAGTVPGTGQRNALAFLTRLRSVLVGRQVLVLPFSDPDSVAMIRAGMGERLASLVATGRTTAGRVLHLPQAADDGRSGLLTGIAMPVNGLVDPDTLSFLTAHGFSEAVLSPTTLAATADPTGAVKLDQSARGGSVVPAVVTDAAVLGGVDDLLSKGDEPGLPVRLNNLAALISGGSFDGTGTPLIVAPDNQWAPKAGALGIFRALLATLRAGGVLAGTPVASIAATATRVATVDYPAEAERAELSPQYLRQVARNAARIRTLQLSLVRAGGTDAPDPGDLLNPLSEALRSVGSAAMRSDNRIGRSILQTTGSTLKNIQDGVSIVGGTSYTLTASTSPLLITVRNELPYIVKIRVAVRGAQRVGMTATDPGLLEIAAGRSQQFKINTNVVKAGRFQVETVLLAADGSAWRPATVITVNSSAYGTLTIVLIAVAGGALFLMVVLRIVQRVRGHGGPAGYKADGHGFPPGEHGGADPGPDSILATANQPPGAHSDNRPHVHASGEASGENGVTTRHGTDRGANER